MMPITVEQLCEATDGQINLDDQKSDNLTLAEINSVVINNVSTDTRTINENDLFIALKGPSFDAHNLLQSAIDKGAAVLLVEKSWVEKNRAEKNCSQNNNFTFANDCIVVMVADTRIALGLLGRYIKQQIKGIKCAAITGSNGKTTCKELLSAILSVHSGDKNKVLATAGNFNNDIGLPLTLLRLQAQHQFAVLELGANHIGEIAYTSALAQPDVALVNNVMPAHLEGFGSLQGVATAKAEIWSNLTPSGIAVVNLEANFAVDFVQKLANKDQPLLGFSTKSEQQNGAKPDLFASDIVHNELGQASFTLNLSDTLVNKLNTLQNISIQLNLPGLHNVSNALAASTMAVAFGCSLQDIKKGLESVQQVVGRVNCSVISETVTVIDDTYNANSASVKAGIDLLAQYQANQVLVCGDMGELGDYAEQEHKTVGEYAQQQGIQKLFTVGNLSQLASHAYNAAAKNTVAEHFTDKQQLKEALNAYLSDKESKTVILVKGSRSAKMEEIVAFIKQTFSA